MMSGLALASLLIALLLAPMVLGTHAVLAGASRRWTSLWLGALIALMVLGLALAAVALLLVGLNS